ncbi:hypothetical protein Tco_0540673, partial [Tanacetum coccineum]
MFKMMMASKSYEKHQAYKALYDALIQSIFVGEDDMDRLVVDHASQKKRRHEDKDEDPSAGSNQGKRKKSKGKDSEPSKKSLASKKTSKCYTPPKTTKSGKSVHAEETVEEDTHEVGIDVEEPVQENVVNDVNQPQDDVVPQKGKLDWIVNDQPQQTWFNNLTSAKKDPLTFDELMATLINFSKFAMNRLKLDKITKADLDGPIYNLLKGTFQSSVELEYNMKECYKALSNQLDWENPKGDWKGSTLILSVVSVTVNKLYSYGYLKEIVVRRADRSLYKFKEGDFVNLHLNDIEDILFLLIQHKLFHLDGDVIVDLAVSLRVFTRRIVIKKRVEDVQLGVEISYQKKLNITKPQKDFPTISAKQPYTPSFDPPGFVYEDLSNQKRLMRADKLYKFSDGTLKKV